MKVSVFARGLIGQKDRANGTLRAECMSDVAVSQMVMLAERRDSKSLVAKKLVKIFDETDDDDDG
jgi:hypothetical protein